MLQSRAQRKPSAAARTHIGGGEDDEQQVDDELPGRPPVVLPLLPRVQAQRLLRRHLAHVLLPARAEGTAGAASLGIIRSAVTSGRIAALALAHPDGQRTPSEQ